MVTDAQKRARDKWNAQNRKVVSIGFMPSDEDILNHLNSQPNKAGYIKELIKQDMEKSQSN